ncbi:MAG: hypothetical protein GMKNLPBB_00875 [Myxococcota bacterium]|nr:hypothetical protein [Myxococcota bacterium]
MDFLREKQLNWMTALRLTSWFPPVMVLLAAAPASAGLYEEVFEGASGTAAGVVAPENEEDCAPLYMPAAKAKLFDHRLEPIALIRPIFVGTFEDVAQTTDAKTGAAREVKSSAMDPNFSGHRQGFVLENAEVGLGGRFNDSGVYYKVMFELAPRGRDGNPRPGDFPRDIYLGWNKYTFVQGQIGYMRVPVSQVNMKPTAQRPLVYSPVLEVNLPLRVLGAKLSGGDPWQIVKVTGGVFNSDPSAVQQMRRFDQLLLTGRFDLRVDNILRVAKAHFMDFEMNLGASMAYVGERFDPPTEHRWFGLDARLHLWRFTLEGEMLSMDFFKPALAGNLDASRAEGWHADLIIHAWPRVIDVIFRIEQYDGDTELENGLGNPPNTQDTLPANKRWYTGGVNLYLTNRTKFALNYMHREELEGFNFPMNDVVMGLFQFDL